MGRTDGKIDGETGRYRWIRKGQEGLNPKGKGVGVVRVLSNDYNFAVVGVIVNTKLDERI